MKTELMLNSNAKFSERFCPRCNNVMKYFYNFKTGHSQCYKCGYAGQLKDYIKVLIKEFKKLKIIELEYNKLKKKVKGCDSP
jgi:DNA-directed RNA polymerase subunit M/transcription elongation factor TFIIS